ncbi:peptide deformylase [Sansalvadorimonas sp. 2012CJ34-2]|uniref:Peptide deformylase n=1 Tax=Parendozoicomonas callyspongiae TaxID=2942213 RepID=A0ABT0PAH5_9GAMM|nr:peptide deformylase [Sansalvadorimonas sp. 2012CJ34-2]MCL6268385.1 peptide deformylase [Sansalvadorimonas sp. 2012CJ34-2]
MKSLPENPDVLLLGEPSLFEIQPPVQKDEISQEVFQHNLSILLESQRRCTGVGMAAPQIGWPARVMNIGIEKSNPRYPWAKVYPLECWINPEIVSASENSSWVWEGCLSVPGFRGWVERPAEVNVRGYNRDGVQVEKALGGFMARVFLHELDHLDGHLFPHRVQSSRLMIPMGSFDNQQNWPEEWPSPGARITRPGEVSEIP